MSSSIYIIDKDINHTMRKNTALHCTTHALILVLHPFIFSVGNDFCTSQFLMWSEFFIHSYNIWWRYFIYFIFIIPLLASWTFQIFCSEDGWLSGDPSPPKRVSATLYLSSLSTFPPHSFPSLPTSVPLTVSPSLPSFLLPSQSLALLIKIRYYSFIHAYDRSLLSLSLL